ncbi:hypothetical protein AVEN_25661-1 [Araneus ventricosus]|uniref:Tc1-like transposase DDE domain-containing protein n=1 Tax=Araneus ventricosus TaxID=182803 RepID=A0A4Y2BQX6_ARAVE|nr:hypothetical protein AVEN_25661-1 [Araneus ventricosus]
MAYRLTLRDQYRQCFMTTLEIIGYFREVFCLPPHSPDLNPCDFWLWVFLKNHVCGGSMRTLPELKTSITRNVAELIEKSFALLLNTL